MRMAPIHIKQLNSFFIANPPQRRSIAPRPATLASSTLRNQAFYQEVIPEPVLFPYPFGALLGHYPVETINGFYRRGPFAFKAQS
jgi:hypothetical protein